MPENTRPSPEIRGSWVKLLQALLFPLPLLVILGYSVIGSIKNSILFLKRFPFLILGLYVLPLFTFLIIQPAGFSLHYGFRYVWRLFSASEGTVAFFLLQQVIANIVFLLKVGVSVLLVTMLMSLLLRLKETMGDAALAFAKK